MAAVARAQFKAAAATAVIRQVAAVRQRLGLGPGTAQIQQVISDPTYGKAYAELGYKTGGSASYGISHGKLSMTEDQNEDGFWNLLAFWSSFLGISVP